jgi:Tfp pilus assembly protein PilO
MALAFLLVLGGGYYFYVTDKQTILERAELKERDLRQDFESKSFRAANLEAYRLQKIEMETTFEGLLRQLPSDTEVPGLLEDITRTALDNELRSRASTCRTSAAPSSTSSCPFRSWWKATITRSARSSAAWQTCRAS